MKIPLKKISEIEQACFLRSEILTAMADYEFRKERRDDTLAEYYLRKADALASDLNRLENVCDQ